MSEFVPVERKEELLLLNENEMVAGYRSGLNGDGEPGSAYSRSYWHGWRNGMADGRHSEVDDAQRKLAKNVVCKHMKMH